MRACISARGRPAEGGIATAISRHKVCVFSILALVATLVLFGDAPEAAQGTHGATPGVVDFLFIDMDTVTPGMQGCASVPSAATPGTPFDIDAFFRRSVAPGPNFRVSV
jgi:hypothetical protein